LRRCVVARRPNTTTTHNLDNRLRSSLIKCTVSRTCWDERKSAIGDATLASRSSTPSVCAGAAPPPSAGADGPPDAGVIFSDFDDDSRLATLEQEVEVVSAGALLVVSGD
jgi:hypothetical protein